MKTIQIKRTFSILSVVLVLNIASLACSLSGNNPPTVITVVVTQPPPKKDSPQPAVSKPTAPKPPAPTKIPPPSKKVSPIDGMTLLYVPAGEFQMGSDMGRDDEKPVHTVYLDAYWIDQTDVTNAMFAKFVSSGGGNQPPLRFYSQTRKSYYQNSHYDDFPVIYVNWDQADAYCKWAGRNLPTEAQWEKAARGTDGRTFPWGEGLNCQKSNYNNCVGDTTRVGSYPAGASPYGVLDMVGNVDQWLADWYSATYYQNSPDKNPTGAGPDEAPNGSARVLRGGSWYDPNDNFPSASRASGEPSVSDSGIGFRCVLIAAP